MSGVTPIVDTLLATTLAQRVDLLPLKPAVPGEEDAIVQVVAPSGRVLNASANFDERGPIAVRRPRGTQAERHTMRGLPESDDTTAFRVVAMRTRAKSGVRYVFVATSLEPVNESVDAVRRILVLGLPVLLVFVGATTWVVVGHALRPVEAIRAQVADFSSRDLSRRVPEPNIDDEVGRLATTMNGMLDRLQRFAERQRAFVADASN